MVDDLFMDSSAVGATPVQAVNSSWFTWGSFVFAFFLCNGLRNLVRDWLFLRNWSARTPMICQSASNGLDEDRHGRGALVGSRPGSAVHTPRSLTTICSPTPSEASFQLVEDLTVDLTE